MCTSVIYMGLVYWKMVIRCVWYIFNGYGIYFTNVYGCGQLLSISTIHKMCGLGNKLKLYTIMESLNNAG